MLTKGNFTRDEWNHLSVLQSVLKWCRKEHKKESGEERVTAKSRPMMSSIARSSERAPSALSSTASERPGKTRQESQSPLSAQAEMYDRTGEPVVCRDTSHERHRPLEKAHSSSYSEWNIDKNLVFSRVEIWWIDSSSTRQLGFEFQDMETPKSSSILRKSSDMPKPIRRVKFAKAVVRHADTRDQNPSLGYICPGEHSSAWPRCSKIWGLVSGRDGMAKAMCPR